mgnify:CR=1 FL=1
MPSARSASAGPTPERSSSCGEAIAPLLTSTSLGLVYAYLVRFSAVALQSVEAGYARLPGSLHETARMLGAGNARILGRIHLPLLHRTVLAAALLCSCSARVTVQRYPAELPRAESPAATPTPEPVPTFTEEQKAYGSAALLTDATVLVNVFLNDAAHGQTWDAESRAAAVQRTQLAAAPVVLTIKN